LSSFHFFSLLLSSFVLLFSPTPFLFFRLLSVACACVTPHAPSLPIVPIHAPRTQPKAEAAEVTMTVVRFSSFLFLFAPPPSVFLSLALCRCCSRPLSAALTFLRAPPHSQPCLFTSHDRPCLSRLTVLSLGSQVGATETVAATVAGLPAEAEAARPHVTCGARSTASLSATSRALPPGRT